MYGSCQIRHFCLIEARTLLSLCLVEKSLHPLYVVTFRSIWTIQRDTPLQEMKTLGAEENEGCLVCDDAYEWIDGRINLCNRRGVGLSLRHRIGTEEQKSLSGQIFSQKIFCRSCLSVAIGAKIPSGLTLGDTAWNDWTSVPFSFIPNRCSGLEIVFVHYRILKYVFLLERTKGEVDIGNNEIRRMCLSTLFKLRSDKLIVSKC